MPRRSMGSRWPAREISGNRRPARIGNLGSRFARRLDAPLGLEPLEDRTLLAVDFGIGRDALAAFPAAWPSSLNLVPYTSQGREVPVLAGEWVVKLTHALAASPGESLAQATTLLGAHVSGLISVESLASSDTFLVHTSANYRQADITTALAAIDGFALVEPNFLAWKDDTFPNDTSFSTQWALHNTGQSGGKVDADIDAPAAWDVNTGSGHTVVGVVDSGVDYSHPDLNDNMWRNPGEVPGDGIDNDANGFVDDVFGYDFLNGDADPMDDEGHGTSVAGIIAAEGNNALGVSGVSWDAQIMALKIFDPFGFAGTAQIVAAINYATMMKNNYGVNVIATNHSWGTVGFSSVLRDAIANAGLADILFVASAGNQQHDNDIAPQYPASFDLDNVISVAATDRLDNRASFTSFGATSVDLGAPGVSTFTTALGGGYRNFSGTSAAAPYVTGVAALVYDTYPNASALEVKQAILAGVDLIPSMAGITLTGGRLNLFGALRAMQMQVVGASPGNGDIVSAPPVDFTIRSAFPITAATVQPADMAVNGIAANSVTVNPTTLVFHFNASPVTAQGAQTLHIAAGAFTRQFDASPVKEFAATFRYDVTPLAVVATTPAGGGIVSWPVPSIRLDFNEAVDPASVDVGDLQLSEGSVSGFVVVDGDTIEYQLAGVASDRRLDVRLAAGAVQDAFGNPNAAFATTLELDAAAVPAGAFERLEPLGGLIFAGRGNGRLFAAADVDRFDFFVEAGQTVAARVTPLSAAASITAEFLGLAGPASSPAPGWAAITAPILAPTSGLVSLRITGNAATDYEVEVFRNAAVENPAGGSPQDISSSAIEIGSRRLGVVGSIDDVLQTDRYVIDLSASVGRPIDIVLAGQNGVSFSGAILELVAPGGSIVTATPDPLGNGATNYDLAILGFVPSAAGNYELRLRSSIVGQYGIVVTERLLFESEANDGPIGAIRSVDNRESVAGFIDPFGQTGAFEFIVDTSQSMLVISGGIGTSEGGVAVPFQEQAPGSLRSNLWGSVQAIVSGGSIELAPQASVFAFEKPGPFQPGNAPADFAASLNAPPFIVGAVLAMRDTAFGMTGGLAVDANGRFAADQLSFVLRQTLAASIPGVINETVQIDDTFVDNDAAVPGSLTLVDGRFELVLPIHVRLLIPVPQFPVAGIFDLDGRIVARAIVPGADDVYEVTLAAGQTLGVATRTPFDHPAATPGNPLDPALELLDSAGAVVAADMNSAPDGKNARLEFTSPTGGKYRIRVLGSGRGEYVLDVDKNFAPVLGPIGNRKVPEGTTLSFKAGATDTDNHQLTFSLAPGAPAGASIHPTSGQFSWKPGDDTGSPFPITVLVSDNGSPQLADGETFWVTVTNVAPSIKSVSLTPSAPKTGDMVTLSVSFADAGILDTHTAMVHWGDGTSSVPTVTKFGGSGSFLAKHVYSSGGIYDVSFTVMDDDGGKATGTKVLLVSGMGVHERGDLTVLEIVGTPGNDTITVTPLAGNRLYVFASFLGGSGRTISAAGLELVKVMGLAGNDFIALSNVFGGVNVPAIIDGGDGNDYLVGGNGPNVILGGRGNDTLMGGPARDILIGGIGADSLFGNGADDILIGGTTNYDSGPIDQKTANDMALLKLLAEWTSGRSYNQRTDNIVNAKGPVLGSTGISLKKGLTVFDDSERDLLSGAAGTDWFFHNALDTVLKTSGEKVNS